MRDIWFLIGSLTAVIACGGTTAVGVDAAGVDTSGSGPDQVQGMVNGKAFNAREAISTLAISQFGFDGTAEIVEITDYAGACAFAGQNMAPTGSLVLVLGVATTDGEGRSTAAMGPGTFTVFSPAQPIPTSASVAAVYYGSGCLKSVSYNGISGTVTISAVAPDGSFTGTFDSVISCADFATCAGPDAHITGSFSSTACTALNVNRTPTCS